MICKQKLACQAPKCPLCSYIQSSISALGFRTAKETTMTNTDDTLKTPTQLEQSIEAERRRLLQVHSVLHCLYEVLLYAEGEDAIMYAEAAHLAAMMVDETAVRLDSMSMKPVIDALKMECGGHGGGGFSVREPPPPPYLLS